LELPLAMGAKPRGRWGGYKGGGSTRGGGPRGKGGGGRWKRGAAGGGGSGRAITFDGIACGYMGAAGRELCGLWRGFSGFLGGFGKGRGAHRGGGRRHPRPRTGGSFCFGLFRTNKRRASQTARQIWGVLPPRNSCSSGRVVYRLVGELEGRTDREDG